MFFNRCMSFIKGSLLKSKTTDSLQQKAGEVDECLICLNAYSNIKEKSYLPCFHYFHGCCLAKWLKTNNSCPVCRTVVSPCVVALIAHPPETSPGILSTALTAAFLSVIVGAAVFSPDFKLAICWLASTAAHLYKALQPANLSTVLSDPFLLSYFTIFILLAFLSKCLYDDIMAV